MTLRWRKPDDYHIRSVCGRFSVSRVNVELAVWYVAWQRSLIDTERASEIGATRLPITAPDSERQAAIREMQQVCETVL